MKTIANLTLTVAAVLLFAVVSPRAQAQVVGVNVGPAPVCPYGYYAYPPYECAPYGYYGPAWFVGGLFIGAGPWYHGPAYFRGPVNNHLDARNGYRGPYPQRGEHPAAHPHGSFHGNEMRDSHGNIVH